MVGGGDREDAVVRPVASTAEGVGRRVVVPGLMDKVSRFRDTNTCPGGQFRPPIHLPHVRRNTRRVRDAVDDILEQWRVERPDLDAMPMGIFARLTRAQRMAAVRLEASFTEHDLNRDDFDALATLRRSGPPFRLTPTQLYRSALVSSGTMTGRIDRLERLGLVDRRADPTDRRGSLVGLTPAGRRLADSLVERLLDDMAALVRDLDEQERTDVAAALRVLLVTLEGDSEGAGTEPGGAIGSRTVDGHGARSHSALPSRSSGVIQ